jgi:hypothetical protein
MFNAISFKLNFLFECVTIYNRRILTIKLDFEIYYRLNNDRVNNSVFFNPFWFVAPYMTKKIW